MKIVFYANTKKEVLNLVEFYKQDIDILENLGYDVKIATRYKEIDLSADIIFIWWWTYALIPVILGKIFNIKTMITGTFNYKCPQVNHDYFRRNFIQRFLIKTATRLSDANILVSKNEYDMMTKDWKFKNFFYSPHCININKYQPNGKRDNNTIFTICRMEHLSIKRKCLYELIYAMKIVHQENKDVKLCIAGRKENGYPDIKDYIDKNDLSDVVKLLGTISEKEKINYLQRCAVYAQPTRFEGFGLASAEAMSCGAPVVSNNAGEVSNVVGSAGIVLDDCEPSVIADSILNLISSDQKRIELGKLARERIIENFPIQRRQKDIEEIIEKVIKQMRI